jgi:hypothetical protein
VFIGGFFLGLIPFHNEDRFRLPWAPVWLLFGGLAAQRTASWIREKRWRQAFATLAVAFLIMGLLRVPENLSYRVRPKDYVNATAAAMLSPRPDWEQGRILAAAAWAQTQRLGGDVSKRREAMISVYRILLEDEARRGEIAKAAEHLEIVIRLDEPRAADYDLLANFKEALGRPQEAGRARLLSRILEPKNLPSGDFSDEDPTVRAVLEQPNNAEAHLARAQALEVADPYSPWAAFHRRKALALDPKGEDRGTIEHHLRRYEVERRSQRFALFDPFAQLREL